MEQRDATKIVILGLVTCGIYTLYWFYQTGEEMRARGADIPAWWWMIIPILGFVYIWKWGEGAEKVTGGAVQSFLPLLLCLFGISFAIPFVVQPKFNAVR